MEPKSIRLMQRLLALVMCAAMLLPMMTPQIAVAAEDHADQVIVEGITGKNYRVSSEAVETATKKLQLTPVSSGVDIKHHGRYVIMDNSQKYILSYDSVSTTGQANHPTSLTWDQDGGSEDTFYFNGEITANKKNGNVVIDQSDRDTALWILRSYDPSINGITGYAGSNKNYGTMPGVSWHYVGDEYRNQMVLGRILTDRPGASLYRGMEFQKGRYGLDDVPGTAAYEGLYKDGSVERATHGYYWYAPKLYSADSVEDNNTCFTHFCYRSDTAPFKNESDNTDLTAKDIRNRYRMERYDQEKFLIYYWNGNEDYRFVYCDENGNWGVRRYLGASEIANIRNDLDELAVRLYEYDPYHPVESGNKKITFSGYTDIYAITGTSQTQIFQAIEESIAVFDADRKEQLIPCSGTAQRVGYYYLARKNAPAGAAYAYQVEVYYKDEPYSNGSTLVEPTTLIQTINVYLQDNPSSTLPEVGIVSKGATWGDVVYKADAKTIITEEGTTTVYEATYDPVTVNVPGDIAHNVKGMMLYKEYEGKLKRFDTDDPGVYGDVQVYYAGTYVGTMTVVVSDTTIKPHMPKYPEAGSVRVSKLTTTMEDQFAQTGVANIQLGATGKANEKGMDLIIMLDLSSSMRYGVDNTTEQCKPYYNHQYQRNSEWTLANWKKTRMYQMEESLRALIQNLQSTGADVRIAIADFGDLDHFEFKDAVIAGDEQTVTISGKQRTVNFRLWPHFETSEDGYDLTATSGSYWNKNYEFPNHLNYVLSGFNTSRTFQVNEWKYLDDVTLDEKGVAEQMRGKKASTIYTGDATDGLANAFVDVNNFRGGNMDTLVEQLRISNSCMLGTNYDIGLEIAYKMAYERKQQNLEDDEDRDIVCIFMSDGAAMQYNYFSGHANSLDWKNFLIGNLITGDGPAGDSANGTNALYSHGDSIWHDAQGSNIVPPLRSLIYPLQDTLHHMHLKMHTYPGLKFPGESTARMCTCGNSTKSENIQAEFRKRTGHEMTWLELFQIIKLNSHLTVPIRTDLHKPWVEGISTSREALSGDALINLLVTSMRTRSDDRVYQTFSPYHYFYNTEGRNWWAEAIKGDEDELYPVINMFAAHCTTDEMGRQVTSLGTVNRSYYNGDVVNNFSGTTTQGLKLDGKEYISGFAGLGMKIYTIGFALADDWELKKEVQTQVLKNIATTENQRTYYYDANSGAALTEALLAIVKNATMGARQLWFTDTMGDDFDLSASRTIVVDNQNVQVNANPRIRVLDYPLDENGNRIGDPVELEVITFVSNKVAKSSLKGDADIWDDTTNMIVGEKVIYNANKLGDNKEINGVAGLDVHTGDIVDGVYKIDMTGDGVGDYQLAPETFFWTIGNMPEVTETVLEYQVYLTGSVEGERPQEWQYYDTNEEAILHFIDHRGNNCTLETQTPKMPWGHGPAADVIVVDYGIPVKIDVTENDTRFKTAYPNVTSISAVSKVDDISEIKGNTGKLHSAFVNAGYSNKSGTTLVDRFGSFCFDGKYVIYTLNTMMFDDIECLAYALKGGNNYYYGSVKILPATTIYYEDDFVSFHVYQYEAGTKDANEIKLTDEGEAALYEAHKWQPAGERKTDKFQNDDRPFDDVADNVYGYDGAYTDMDTYSLGSAMKFKASKDGDLVTYGTAEFEFSGTGFDVISVTSNLTGAITVQVTGMEDSNRDVSRSLLVDTFYGYHFVDTDGDGKKEWTPNPSADGALYQVPVIKVDGLEYGKYKAVITCSYNDFFNHGQYETKQYDFYLDAIRIYDPADDGANNEIIEDAYVSDSEGWPEYFELRNLLINKNTFDSLNGSDTTVNGIVFIDGFARLTGNSNTGNTCDSVSAQISDYKNYGPNNEVYLAPGQAIAFFLDIPSTESHKVAAIQLALKSVGGEAKVKIFDAQKPAFSYVPDSIDTATDLYYKITDLNKKTVVIANVGANSDAILSVTNVKVTYDAPHEDVINGTFFRVSSARMKTAVNAINELMASLGEQDPGEVINGAVDLKGASLSFEDEILTNLYYTVSGIEATEMGLLTWSSEPVDGSVDNAEKIYTGAVYDEAMGHYMVQTDGIAAKNLGDDIYMRVYARTENGIVYSDVTKYSPRQYALSRLEKSRNENMKALCVAMLNYGAAAQEYFGYKTEELMNASLTAQQQALVSAYSADLFAGAVAADANKIGSFAKTEGFSAKSASVSFEGAFAINYYFGASAEVAGDVTFCYWTAADYAKADVLTADNATGTFAMQKQPGAVYWAQIDGIAAKELDDTFYVTAVYTDAEGNTHCTGIIAYSVSHYCMNNANGAMGDLAQATAIYGYHAKVYFGMEG